MKLYFIVVLVVMITVTSWASMHAPVVQGLKYVLSDPWGVATFCDTYFAFLTVYLWMAYKEPAWFKRIAWLIGVVLFGTIAIAVFFLHELYLNRGEPIERFLVRRVRA